MVSAHYIIYISCVVFFEHFSKSQTYVFYKFYNAGTIHGLDTVLKPPELDLDELCNDGTTTTTSTTTSSSSTTTSTTSSKSAKAAQKMKKMGRTRVHNMEEEGQGKVRSRSRR